MTDRLWDASAILMGVLAGIGSAAGGLTAAALFVWTVIEGIDRIAP